jgi:hypothetical protein
MTYEEFIRVMTKELFVYRMAAGPRDSRSVRTRLTRVRRRIDDAVLRRAAAITDERRCAALGGEQLEIRCEFSRGHPPVPGRRGTPGGLTMHDQLFDHAAPSRGVWWMEPEEA